MTDRGQHQADTAQTVGEPASADAGETPGRDPVTDGNPSTTQDKRMHTLEQDLVQAQQEAAANNEKYLRARADMENYKKRIERTYADLARSSKKELLTKLLGVKDNLERAVSYGEQATGNGEGILEGVRLTQYQLDQLLAHEGVKPIEAQGKPFNPHLEEAVQTVHDQRLPDHQVVREVRKGYTYGDHDELLRPAQVVVNVRNTEQQQ